MPTSARHERSSTSTACAGVGGSERHLLTLLPALRARGVDARFLGLDDGDPRPVLRAARRARSALRPSPRPARPRSACSLVRHGPRPAAAAAGHRAHAPRPCRRLRRARLDRRASDARQHEAQRRPLPARLVPARRAALRASRGPDHLHHRRARPLQRPARSACPQAKLVVVHYGLDELPAAWGPPGRGRPGRTRRCCSRSRGSSSRRGSTSRSRRWRRSGPPARRRRLVDSRRRQPRGASSKALAERARRRRGDRLRGPHRRRRPLARAGRRASSTRPAGRDSASSCSRRCSRGCRSSRARSARSRRSSSTARRASSSPRTTPRGSPTAIATLLADRRAAHGVRRGGPRAGALTVLGRADGRRERWRSTRRRSPADRARGARSRRPRSRSSALPAPVPGGLVPIATRAAGVGASELDERLTRAARRRRSRRTASARGPRRAAEAAGSRRSTGRQEAHASKTTLSGAPERVLLTSAHERPRSAGTSLRAIGPPSVDDVTEPELVDEPDEAGPRLLVAAPRSRCRGSGAARRRPAVRAIATALHDRRQALRLRVAAERDDVERRPGLGAGAAGEVGHVDPVADPDGAGRRGSGSCSGRR